MSYLRHLKFGSSVDVVKKSAAWPAAERYSQLEGFAELLFELDSTLCPSLFNDKSDLANVLEDIMAAALLPSVNVTPRKRAFASGDGSDVSSDEEGERPVARVEKKEKALHSERLAEMQTSIFESYGKKFRADEYPTKMPMARLKRCAIGLDGLVRFTNAPMCSPAYMRAAVLPNGEFAVYKAGAKVTVEGYPRMEVHKEECDFNSCEEVLQAVLMMYKGYILVTWALIVDVLKYE